MRLTRLLKNKNRLLASLLLLNNLLNIFFFVFFSFLLWCYYGKDNIKPIVLSFYSFLSTSLVVLFGEFIPKSYSVEKNLYVSRKVSKLLVATSFIFGPISSILVFISDKINSLLSKKKEFTISKEQLYEALTLSSIQTKSQETNILKSIAELGYTPVTSYIKPVRDLTLVPLTSTKADIIKLIQSSISEAWPVYDKDRTDIVGIFYAKDLNTINNNIADSIRTCLEVQSHTTLDYILFQLVINNDTIAIVKDGGRVKGVIMIEDIIEIFINKSKISSKRKTALQASLNSKEAPSDVCQKLNLPSNYFEKFQSSISIGGILTEYYGGIPPQGTTLVYRDLIFIISQSDHRSIKKIKVIYSK